MTSLQKRTPGRYARFVSNYPWIILVLDVLVVAVCTPIVLWQHGWPVLEEPTKGFEPRGTVISGQQLALEHLRSHLDNGSLRTDHRRAAQDQHPDTPGITTREPGSTEPTEGNVECLLEPVPERGQGPRLVFELKGEALTARHLRELCDVEEEMVTEYWGEPCGDWSLSHVVASLLDKACDLLTDGDVDDIMDLLQTCRAVYFSHNAPKHAYCHQEYFTSRDCKALPWQCVQNNAVYNILHYFTDIDFMSAANKTHLTYTTIFLPASAKYEPNKLQDFFLTKLNKPEIYASDAIHLAGIELNISLYMFNYYILEDLPLFGLAAGLVTFLMLIYMRSIVLVLTVLLIMAFTVVVSYFLYFVVFRLTFFPFINLLSLLILLAKGINDAFIFYDLWYVRSRYHRRRLGKSRDPLDRPCDLEVAMSRTLQSGVVAILVTALCSGGALLAGLISHITAIRGFAVFAGTGVLVNFCFLMTLLPAVCVMKEMVEQACYEECPGLAKGLLCCAKVTVCWRSCWKSVGKGITFLWPIWFAICLALGIGGIMVVFLLPKLSLPTAVQSQIYTNDHPFEIYEQIRPHLRFEEADREPFEIAFIWGVQSADTGNYMDPDSKGYLTFDPEFDPYAPESQIFMREFCHDVKNFELVVDEIGNGERPCFMDVWREVIQGDCHPDHGGVEFLLEPCCNLTFPLNVTMARLCLTHNLALGYLRRRYEKTLGDIMFDQENQVRVFQYIVELTKYQSVKYDETKEVYAQLESFLQDELAKAPAGLKNGWFGSSLDQFALYDLQTSLSTDTLIVVGVSIAIACLALLISSCNIVLTLFATVAIIFINAVTVGALVLYGWALDAIESVAIIMAVSLSLTFTVHFAIAYGQLKHKSRRSRTLAVIINIAPAVTIAALTIFVAGASLYPGHIFAYQHFGIFLMIVISASWLYSLFFFLPLSRGIGPSGNCGDLRCRNGEEDVLNDIKIKTPPPRTTPQSSNGTLMYPSELYRKGRYVSQYHGALRFPTTTLDRSRQSRLRTSWYEQSRLPRLKVNPATGSVRGEDFVGKGWI